MARGNRRLPIVYSDADFDLFAETIAETADLSSAPRDWHLHRRRHGQDAHATHDGKFDQIVGLEERLFHPNTNGNTFPARADFSAVSATAKARAASSGVTTSGGVPVRTQFAK